MFTNDLETALEKMSGKPSLAGEDRGSQLIEA